METLYDKEKCIKLCFYCTVVICRINLLSQLQIAQPVGSVSAEAAVQMTYILAGH